MCVYRCLGINKDTKVSLNSLIEILTLSFILKQNTMPNAQGFDFSSSVAHPRERYFFKVGVYTTDTLGVSRRYILINKKIFLRGYV